MTECKEQRWLFQDLRTRKVEVDLSPVRHKALELRFPGLPSFGPSWSARCAAATGKIRIDFGNKRAKFKRGIQELQRHLSDQKRNQTT
jgi:hypothetical protein